MSRSGDRVRKLFGNRLQPLVLIRWEYVAEDTNPYHYLQFFKEAFGSEMTIYVALAGQTKWAAFDRGYLEFVMCSNRDPPRGSDQSICESLFLVSRKSS